MLPKACSTGCPQAGGAEPRGDAGAAPEVQSSGLQGQSSLGRAGRALPLPADTSQARLLHINILTTTPLQSVFAKSIN